MASDGWTPTTLGECARWVSGGTPSKRNPAYWGGDMPWVSAKDMKEFRLYDSQDHVTAEALGNGTRSVPPRSILLLVRGMTLHDDLPICMVMREMTFNQDVKALVPHDHVVLQPHGAEVLRRAPPHRLARRGQTEMTTAPRGNGVHGA